MNNDANKLLKELEPVIEKKCREIRMRKHQNRILFLLCISFLLLPSLFLLLNINLIYFLIGILIFFLLRFFIQLPDILKRSLEDRCYE